MKHRRLSTLCITHRVASDPALIPWTKVRRDGLSAQEEDFYVAPPRAIARARESISVIPLHSRVFPPVFAPSSPLFSALLFCGNPLLTITPYYGGLVTSASYETWEKKHLRRGSPIAGSHDEEPPEYSHIVVNATKKEGRKKKEEENRRDVCEEENTRVWCSCMISYVCACERVSKQVENLRSSARDILRNTECRRRALSDFIPN